MKLKNKVLKSTTPSLGISSDEETSFNLDLNMNNFRIINVMSDPTKLNDCCTKSSTTPLVLKVLNESSSEKFIPLTGTVPNKNVTGNLIFNSAYTMTGMVNPVNDTDIANLETLNTLSGVSVADLVNINGGILTGNLDMNGHPITGLTPSAVPSSNNAISLIALKNTVENLAITYLTSNGSDQTITGDLIFNATGTVRDIPNPVADEDLVNKEYMETFIADTGNYYLKIDGTNVMKGSINAGGRKVINLPEATRDNDAADFLGMKNTVDLLLSPYLPLSGGTITGTFSSTDALSGLVNGTDPDDAVNLGQLVQIINTLIPLNGSKSLSGDIDISGNKITGLFNATTDQDAVTKLQLEDFFVTKIPLSGNSLGSEITGNLVLNGTAIKGLPTGSNNKDAINFLQVKNNSVTAFSSYVKLDGTVPLAGNINAGNHGIINLAASNLGSDAVNLGELQTHVNNYSLDYVLLNTPELTGALNTGSNAVTITDGTSNQDGATYSQSYTQAQTCMPLSGGTFLQNQSVTTKVTNLADGTANDDIVNLGQLNTILSTKFPLSGGSLTGTLDMANQKITGLADASVAEDAMNKKQLSDALIAFSTQYIKLDGSNTPVNFQGNLDMQNNPIENLGDYNASTSAVKDAINKKSFDTLTLNKTAPYFSKATGLLSGNLNMNGNAIDNVGDPVNTYDCVNVQTFNTAVTTYLPLTGGTLTQTLTLKGSGQITNLKAGTANDHAVNGAQLYSTINDASYVNLGGDTMTGPINLGSEKITNVVSSTATGSLTNLNTTSTTVNNYALNYLPLNGSRSMIGYLDMQNQVITTADGTANTDGVNYGQLKTGATNTLLRAGTGGLQQTLQFNGTAKIINLPDPSPGANACNMRSLKSILETQSSLYLKLDGSNFMTSSLNMNTHNIQLGNTMPTNDGDPCTLQKMQSLCSSYAPVTGGTFTGSITLNGLKNMALPYYPEHLITKQVQDAAFKPELYSILDPYTHEDRTNPTRLHSWLGSYYLDWSWFDDTHIISTTNNYTLGSFNGVNDRLYLTHSALYLFCMTIHGNMASGTSSILNLTMTLNGTTALLAPINLLGTVASYYSSFIPCRFPETKTSCYLSLKNNGNDISLRSLAWSLINLSGIYQ